MTPDDAVDPHGGEGGVKGGHQVSLSHTAAQGLLKLQSYWWSQVRDHTNDNRFYKDCFGDTIPANTKKSDIYFYFRSPIRQYNWIFYSQVYRKNKMNSHIF